MGRSAVIVAAGKSFDPQLLPRIWEHGDVLAINYAGYPIHDAGLRPTYYLNWDRPDRFSLDLHRDPQVRSIIQADYEPIAKANGFRNWVGVRLAKRKIKPEVNPFTRPVYVRPYKSILVATQFLVRCAYTTIFYWGCDFIPDRDRWYSMSSAPLNDKVFSAKVNSNEEQLAMLRRWHPFAADMNCEWISLSAISRLNEFMTYRPIIGA
jgi:hypothetical protein